MLPIELTTQDVSDHFAHHAIVKAGMGKKIDTLTFTLALVSFKADYHLQSGLSSTDFLVGWNVVNSQCSRRIQ